MCFSLVFCLILFQSSLLVRLFVLPCNQFGYVVNSSLFDLSKLIGDILGILDRVMFAFIFFSCLAYLYMYCWSSFELLQFFEGDSLYAFLFLISCIQGGKEIVEED